MSQHLLGRARRMCGRSLPRLSAAHLLVFVTPTEFQYWLANKRLTLTTNQQMHWLVLRLRHLPGKLSKVFFSHAPSVTRKLFPPLESALLVQPHPCCRSFFEPRTLKSARAPGAFLSPSLPRHARFKTRGAFRYTRRFHFWRHALKVRQLEKMHGKCAIEH